MCRKKIPARFVLIVMGFIGTFNLYSLRTNLSVAIVDMIDFEGLKKDHGLDARNQSNFTFANSNIAREQSLEECPETDPKNASQSRSSSPKFLWNGAEQGQLLSCYFYGYMVTQVLGAYLGRRFGRVRVLGLCVLGSSTLTIIFPLIVTRLGYPSAVIIRILIGLFSGVTMPTIFALTASWSPVDDRSKFISIQFAGIPLGTCVVMPVAGVLTKAFGWESTFYATGLFGFLWAVIWLVIMYDTPGTHPRITMSEKQLISRNASTDSEDNRKRTVPWCAILTSRAWMCLAFTHFSSLFGRYLMITMLPTYLKTVLKFNVKASGFLSSIPFLLGAVMLFATGPLADCLIARNIKSIYVRKVLTTIGLLTSSISITVVSYLKCDVPSTMVLFTMSVAMDSLVIPGFKACLMEITPEFSGISYGLSNTFSSLSGIIAPQVTGFLRDMYEDKPIIGWRASFWIGGIIYFLGAVTFLIFGTNKKQPWSYNDEEKEQEMKRLERT